jgi:hypothetical protein
VNITADRQAQAEVGYVVGSDLGLLRDLKSIIDLDPKIPYGAFELSMPQKQLNCSKIFCSPGCAA